MTGNAKPPQGLVDAIVDGVAKVVVPEMRVESMMHGLHLVEPIPHDTERTLNVALVRGWITHEDVLPLEGKHFGLPVFGVIWEIARQSLHSSNLRMGLVSSGYPWGEGVVDELMFDTHTPIPSLPELAGYAVRVKACWEIRTLCRRHGAALRELAAESITVPEYYERLRAGTREIKD